MKIQGNSSLFKVIQGNSRLKKFLNGQRPARIEVKAFGFQKVELAGTCQLTPVLDLHAGQELFGGDQEVKLGKILRMLPLFQLHIRFAHPLRLYLSWAAKPRFNCQAFRISAFCFPNFCFSPLSGFVFVDMDMGGLGLSFCLRIKNNPRFEMDVHFTTWIR